MSDRLREYIHTSGHTRASIARETGVSESALSRFHHRETTFSLEAVDALAAFLGLELKQTAKPARGEKPRGHDRRTTR